MDTPEEPERDVLEILWGRGVPCCTGCGRPYRPDQYYCDHCGTAVGQRTPYVPYVNIPFNYGPFVRIWKGVKGLEARQFPAESLLPGPACHDQLDCSLDWPAVSRCGVAQDRQDPPGGAAAPGRKRSADLSRLGFFRGGYSHDPT